MTDLTLTSPFDTSFVNRKKHRRVIRLVHKYNRYSERWGFEPLRYNVFTRVVESLFQPKRFTANQSLYSGFLTSLQNRYMSRLYDKIFWANMDLIDFPKFRKHTKNQ